MSDIDRYKDEIVRLKAEIVELRKQRDAAFKVLTALLGSLDDVRSEKC